MKIITITIYLTLITIPIVAQTKKVTFESGIRIQRTEFIPFEYSRNVSDSRGYSNIYPIRNNEKTINPFFIFYKNLDNGYGIEFEYSSIKIERANYFATYYGYDYNYSKQYLRNNERNDFKGNLFFYPFNRFQEYFAIGTGLRRIDRVRNSDRDNFQAEEKISALGPQLVFKSKIPLTESISINLGLDFYHSQGKRNYSYADSTLSSGRTGLFSGFSYIDDNGKTKGIFQGYEARIELKYNLLENYNLSFGYNYNYSYFKYENLNDNYYYFTTYNNYFTVSDSKLSNGKEILKGFYFAGSTVF